MKQFSNTLYLGLFGLGLIMTLSACHGKTKSALSYSPDDVDELIQLMTGSFTSAEQANADSSYYNIALHMYPIWESKEGNYLYVEQAVASMSLKPYRQRIYQVERLPDGSYKSAVYAIEHDSLFIGAWRKPDLFDDFGPEIMLLREGCDVYLSETDDKVYAGSTRNQDCSSTLRGASYASSIVEISASQISSWDQGFDSDGQQVWGAVEGPYVFKRPVRSSGTPKLKWGAERQIRRGDQTK